MKTLLLLPSDPNKTKAQKELFTRWSLVFLTVPLCASLLGRNKMHMRVLEYKENNSASLCDDKNLYIFLIFFILFILFFFF